MKLEEEIAHYLAGLRVSDSTINNSDSNETVDGDKSKSCPDPSKEGFQATLVKSRQRLAPSTTTHPSLHPKDEIKSGKKSSKSSRGGVSPQYIANLKSKFQEMLKDPESRPMPGDWAEFETPSLEGSYGPWIARVENLVKPVRDHSGRLHDLHIGDDTVSVAEDETIHKIIEDMNNVINKVLEKEENTVDIERSRHLQMGDDTLAVSDDEGISNIIKDMDKLIEDVLDKEGDTADVAANTELEIIRGCFSHTSSERSLAKETAAKGSNGHTTVEGDREEIAKAEPVNIDEWDWDDCDVGEV